MLLLDAEATSRYINSYATVIVVTDAFPLRMF